MPSSLGQDRGPGARTGRRVEPQVLSNSGIHEARGSESAEPSQPIREPTGGVAEPRASRSGRLQHDVGHDVRLEALGSADSVATGLNHRTPLRSLDEDLGTNAAPYVGFIDRFRDAFRRETAAFVSLVTGEGPNPCPPEAALESLRAAIACERSVATGAPVRVADIPPPDR